MKTMIVAVGSLLCAPFAHGGDSKTVLRATSPDRVSLYEVPLVCPAAPQIGCGSRSKPILLALERQSGVAEAWLNRAGTTIAVVWKPETKGKARASAFKAVSDEEDFDGHELRGVARKKALNDFRSSQEWFRGSAVDRLSEEESGIIASRLVRRIQAKVPVSEETAKALRVEIASVFKRRFTGSQAGVELSVEEELLKILKGHLDEQQVTVLKVTLPRSLRPLPGENEEE